MLDVEARNLDQLQSCVGAGDIALGIVYDDPRPQRTGCTPSRGSRIFRLSAERAWPLGGTPRFTCLATNDVEAKLTRAQVVDFCERFFIECRLPEASLTNCENAVKL